MNTYAVTFRAAGGLRMCPVQADGIAAAWACAFDVIEALGVPVAGIGVRRLGAAA